MRYRFVAAIAACFSVSVAAAPAGQNKDVPPLHYLSEADAAPNRLLPPPPTKDTAELAREMARVREIVSIATPERLSQARVDDDNETPSAFDSASGRKLEALPATSKLLGAIIAETEAVTDRAKLYFAMPRPYQIDPALPHCGKGTSAFKSYPSGHAGFGYSTGWALARLIPSRSSQILARADDYAFSREVCGVHFHVDTEASRVIGTFVAERMLADPRLKTLVIKAKAELARP